MIIPLAFTPEMQYQDFKITKKKDGRQFCRIAYAYETDAVSGKKRYFYKEIYGCDKNDIAVKRATYITEVINTQSAHSQHDSLFSTKMNEWLYEVKHGDIKLTSFDRLEGVFIHQISPALPHLAHCKLIDIDATDIRSIIKYNLHKGYSYSTLLKIYRFLNEFFDYQVSTPHSVEKNPVRQVKMYKKAFVESTQKQLREKRSLLRNRLANSETLTEDELALANSTLKIEDKNEMRILTDEEIAQLKAAAYMRFKNGTLRIKQGIFFLFMLNTGLQAGEAQALQYKDFDYTYMTVSITRNITCVKQRDANGQATHKRSVLVGDTKTQGSSTTLRISAAAIDIIREMQAEEPEGYDGYIVHNNHKMIEPRALEKRFYNLLRLANIEQTGLHTLRHTFASKLYKKTNGDSKLVSEQLRHSSVGFTVKTYIHLEQKYKTNTMESFEI